MNAHTLNALASFPDQLESLYASFPHDWVRSQPDQWDGIPSESLTALEQLCHVRDIEIDGYHARIRRTLSEEHPRLLSIDTYRLRNERGYHKSDASIVLNGFRAARKETLTLISTLDEAAYARTASFEGYGDVTLRGIVHYLASHDQQHLAGLQWLLGKLHTPASV
jgi:DinB superfamily